MLWFFLYTSKYHYGEKTNKWNQDAALEIYEYIKKHAIPNINF